MKNLSNFFYCPFHLLSPLFSNIHSLFHSWILIVCFSSFLPSSHTAYTHVKTFIEVCCSMPRHLYRARTGERKNENKKNIQNHPSSCMLYLHECSVIAKEPRNVELFSKRGSVLRSLPAMSSTPKIQC